MMEDDTEEENNRQTKLSKEVLLKMNKRLQEAYDSGELKTKFIKIRSTSYVRTLRRVASMVCTQIEDVLKSPGSCAADPSFLVPASLNIYYGRNVRASPQKYYVVRTAYALGTGTSSIGIYPKQWRLHHMFPDMEKLLDIVRKRVKNLYPDLDCDFNQCSIKLYFDGKFTNDHTDINFTEDHSGPHPYKVNSQKPNTPVAICTIGVEKIYRLRRYTGNGKGEPADNSKDIHLLQKNLSLLAAHPGDEELNTSSDRYKFWLKHSAKMVDEHGVAMSIIFRVTQVTALVDTRTNKLVNPKVTGKRKPIQFQNGIKAYNKKYEVAKTSPEEILERIRKRLSLEHNRRW
jgi:hypothetical protein